MILGLDISTSCTGVTILDYTGRVVLNDCWKFKEDDVFDKLERAKKEIQELKKKYPITQVFVEESLQAFRPGFSSAKTILSLAKFNGILCWMIWEEMAIKVQYIGSTTARKSCGIKIVKGTPAKQQVMDWMLQNQSWFKIEHKKNSENIKDHFYDMADSWVIAKAGLLLLNKESK
jgi:Holliday junction resolvasome RuvABC endonuclease subunit